MRRKPTTVSQQGKLPQEPDQPTPTERAAVEAFFGKMAAKPPAPRLKRSKSKDGTSRLATDHRDETMGVALLMASLGVTDPSLYRGLINQLARLESCRGGELDADCLNVALGVARAAQPQDELEALLAVQMAAVHLGTMRMAQQLLSATTLEHRDSAERTLNKLARTFATQLEALRKYRNGGEQRVTVEHVTVNEGGQAIVGNVRGGGVSRKDGETP